MQLFRTGSVRAAKCPNWWFAPIVCATFALLISGCSSFNRAWKAAEQTPPEVATIAGRWEGTWRSDVNGHHDRLRALITPQTNGGYSARFQAEYKKVFRFRFGYTVPLVVTREQDRWRFNGGADLGWYAGGRYTYEGFATVTNFFSTYQSKHDYGTFRMTRPATQ